tara:strand:+ start:435 stop:1301 length:867 start_codon:yes stop_codon:yes gene_type:complete
MLLKDKTIFMSGGSRGIGLAIAKRFARDGANVIIAAKTVTQHPRLEGTIHTACQEIELAGGQALAVQTDIRFEDQIKAAVQQGVERFGGIDIVINNASAIYLLNPEVLKMKQYDMMFAINARGSYMVNTHCFDYLKQSENPHILSLSPPINMKIDWFKNNIAYTQSKYVMSMNVIGFSESYKKYGIAVNALWPKTIINTDAIKHISPDLLKHSRKPSIMADAAYWMVTQKSSRLTGKFLLDQDVLEKSGKSDMSRYSVDPTQLLMRDLFVGDPKDALKMLDIHGNPAE